MRKRMTEKETDLPKDAVSPWQAGYKPTFPHSHIICPRATRSPIRTPIQAECGAPPGSSGHGASGGLRMPGRTAEADSRHPRCPFPAVLGKRRPTSGCPPLLNSSSQRKRWTPRQHGVLRKQPKLHSLAPTLPSAWTGLQAQG